jgi:hypothetical protein
VDLANLGSESETCVGSRVRLVGVSISFKKNFYQLPFTPPLWFAISVLQGIRGGYDSTKQNFLPHKPGTTAVIDHEITTRRADAAEPSQCRQTH